MGGRKRKHAGGVKPERNVRAKPTKFIQEDDSDEYDNEIGFKRSSRQVQKPVSEDGDAARPEPAPPSPDHELTFREILRRQKEEEKEKEKQKKSMAAKADKAKGKPTKFIQKDDSDEYDNEIGFKRSSRQVQKPVSEDGDAASAEPAPPSPDRELTFGEILRRQREKEKEKQKQKQKKSMAAKADKAKGSVVGDEQGFRSGRAEGRNSRPPPRPPARANKHAPMEMSSRYPVPFGRDWWSGDATIGGISVKTAAERSRDPRFFLPPMTREEERRAERNYAFLDEYRDIEIAQLREQIQEAERIATKERKQFNLRQKKKAERWRERGGGGRGGGYHNNDYDFDDDEEAPTNTQKGQAAEAEVAELTKKLMSMEAVKRDREAKAKQQALLDEHRKRERDLVKQGKKPYYLKKSEQRRRLLVDQFAGMSEQQADKAIEKRRKKAAMREKKKMPSFRK